MQTPTRILRLTLLFLTLAFAFSGCSSLTESLLQKPEVDLKGITLRDTNLQGTTVVFVLNLKNPNARDLPLDGLTYQVDLGGKHFADGRLEEKVRIPAKGESQVEVPLTVAYSKVFSGLAQMLEGRSLDYALRGNAKFSVFSIPFEEKGDLKLTE